MYRNMLTSVSCDCETVKNVVTGNSLSKPDRTGRDGKFVKQSKMLNNSAYSRLGNNSKCFGVCVIISTFVVRCLNIEGTTFVKIRERRMFPFITKLKVSLNVILALFY